MKEHIKFDAESMNLILLDQRLLPMQTKYFVCKSVKDVIYAIKNMVVRGAPAIGVTAAFGCVLAANESAKSVNWRENIDSLLLKLRKARPTAVNLEWAVERMMATKKGESPHEIAKNWLKEAIKIQEEDISICKKIGQAGESLIQDGDTVLTHCNAGALATAGYGTALGVIRAAVERGKKVKVIADETRPLLQGSRLTAYELVNDNIPVTVTCDNASAFLMSQNKIQLVITGADRIAANGDTANKIGTLGVAIAAKYYGIPFYIAAPLSTIDSDTSDGAGIPIESRSTDEVLTLGEYRMAPEGVDAYNFAFDITPAELISGIITEYGILRKPYSESIESLVSQYPRDWGHR